MLGSLNLSYLLVVGELSVLCLRQISVTRGTGSYSMGTFFLVERGILPCTNYDYSLVTADFIDSNNRYGMLSGMIF